MFSAHKQTVKIYNLEISIPYELRNKLNEMTNEHTLSCILPRLRIEQMTSLHMAQL